MLGPVISLEYAFRSAEGETEDDLSPLLVAYDHRQFSLWILEVEEKGVGTEVGVAWLAQKLQFA